MTQKDLAASKRMIPYFYSDIIVILLENDKFEGVW